MEIIESKHDLTEVLCNILASNVYNDIKNIYKTSIKHYNGLIEKAKEDPNINPNKMSILQCFQINLDAISKLPQLQIKRLLDKNKVDMGCVDWFDKLLDKIYQLTIISLTCKKDSRLAKEFVISPVTFLHQCYIQCATEFYHNPYLFWHEIEDPMIILANQEKAREIVRKSIKNAILMTIPMDKIIQEMDEPILSIPPITEPSKIDLQSIPEPILYEKDKFRRIEQSDDEIDPEILKTKLSGIETSVTGIIQRDKKIDDLADIDKLLNGGGTDSSDDDKDDKRTKQKVDTTIKHKSDETASSTSSEDIEITTTKKPIKKMEQKTSEIKKRGRPTTSSTQSAKQKAMKKK